MAERQLPKLNTRVRFPSPAPRRSKVRFAPTFFVYGKNVIRPLPCSSVSNRTRCCWASVWGRRFAAVLPFYTEISLLTVPSKRKEKTSAESRCLSSFWVFLDPSPPSQLFPHPQYAQIYLPNQKNPAAQPVLAMPLNSLLPDFLIHQFVQFLDVSGLIGNSVVGLFGI